MASAPMIVTTSGGEMAVATDTYTYEVSPDVTLSANSAASAFLTFEADTDFVLQKLTFKTYANDFLSATDLENDNQQIPNILLQITDTASGRRYFESPIPINNLFGTGNLPFIFREPPIIAARSKWLFDFNNYNTSNQYGIIILCLTGTKIYLKGFS